MKIKRLPLILFGILCLSLACNLPLQNNNPPAPTSPVEIIAPTIPPSTGGDLPTQPEQTGTSLPLSTPQGNLAHRIIAISANGARSLAVDETGQVWQWGTLYSPSSGCDNPGDCLRQPTRVAGLTNVASVAAGGSFSLALKQDGTVWAWGKNEIYQLGQGSNVVEYAAEPLIVPGLSEVIALCASDNFSLALKKDGSVWAWGHDPMGALGNDKTPTSNVPYMYETIPAQVVELGGVKSIACGVSHSVALDQSGQVWAWGNNQQGELGVGSFDSDHHSRPEKVPGLQNAVFVAAGGNNTLAIRADGSVWAWGANYLGQLGTSEMDFTPHPNPVRIDAFQGAQMAVVSIMDTGVIKPDGSYWNTFGLSQGAPLAGLPPVVWVSGGANHQLALTADGQVWAWGENSAGQLGNEISEATFTPISVEFTWE